MCEVACNNTAGSFHCACMPGYVLNSDERTCRGEEKTRPCPLWKINILNFSQIWMSVLLVWTCVTRIASTLLALTHAAATVHTHSTTMASDAMVCKRESDTILWSFIRLSDINECAAGSIGNTTCLEVCVNSPGSWECGCFPGYTLLPDRVSCRGLCVGT